MACRYTYKGKTYEAHEFDDVLRAMPLSEAAAFIPGVRGIPAAPFVTRTEGWLNLALKRAITMAVEGGYDKIAFTNGQQNADRYDLSKQISTVEFIDNVSGGAGLPNMDGPVGAGMLRAYDMSGSRVMNQRVDGPADVESYVGKEVAQRLLESKPTASSDAGIGVRRRSLSGLDLKVGGEGMKAFYDTIVPNAVRALVKKLGGRVEMVQFGEPADRKLYVELIRQRRDMPEGPERDALTQRINAVANAIGVEKGKEELRGAGAQPGLVITDEMRAKVGDGLPLFSRRRQTDAPEFRAWFGDSKVVDADGRPLVVYHGTGADFSAFDPDADGNHLKLPGIFFTPDPGVASAFAENDAKMRENKAGRAFAPNGAQVMPVYLSMQNPLEEDVSKGGQRGFYPPSAIRDVIREAQRLGRDGVILRGWQDGSGPVQYVVFRPEQIKSATGNNGQFDPANPDITKSSPRTLVAPSSTRFDDIVYKLQDKFIDLKRVSDQIRATGRTISDAINAYQREELFHKRTAERTADFATEELNPVVNLMRMNGLSIEDVEEYLHARHAEEANNLIASREPSMPDGGSGMTTANARAYLAGLDPAQRRRLEAVAARVDAIIDKTRQTYVDYGLIDQEQADAWATMFQYYVPLMREDKDGLMGVGQGFNIRGKEVRSRTGSTRKVVDILANIAMQRERAIVRGEKNRVDQALLGLAQANPDPEFWEVRSQPPTERVYDQRTNSVIDRPDPLWKNRPNVLTAKVMNARGKVTEQSVVFNPRNQRAVRLAGALKNLDHANLEGLLAASAKVTRYFASVNTQYNPVFGIVNLIRDTQAAAINLGSTPLAGDRAKIIRDTGSAIAGIYSDIRAVRKGRPATSRWAQLWEQLKDDGGTTGYRELFATSQDRADALRSALDPTAWMNSKLGRLITADGTLKAPVEAVQKAGGALFDWLSDYNETFENGVRLAAYKAALDRGMSREQAASIAKNLTVNFNRKGAIGTQMGALYAFFNAAMQGTARIGQSLFDMQDGDLKTLRLSKLGQKVVAGGVLLGVMQALALAAAGYDDEDPPDFVRERSLIIPLGEKYATIPMPLGFHVIPGLGRHATEFILSGGKDPVKRVAAIVGMFADAFNPIGNAGFSIQTIAPTALDPIVALSENKDWTGKPIARTSFNKAEPGHAQWKDTATSWGKVIAEAINWLTGGNEYRAGVISPTPDQIDYLIAQITGGVGREISKVDQTLRAAATGESLPIYKAPLVGRFIGDTRSQASEGVRFYAHLNRINEVETEFKGMVKDKKFTEAQEFRATTPETKLIAVANAAERQVQLLRRQKRELIEQGASPEKVRAKEEQITGVMSRLNRAVEQAGL